jgi:hypothetical protein
MSKKWILLQRIENKSPWSLVIPASNITTDGDGYTTFVDSTGTKATWAEVTAGSNDTKFVTAKAIKDSNVVNVVTWAWTPTATTTVPTKVGQIYIDTAASKVYVAKATTAESDFLILN